MSDFFDLQNLRGRVGLIDADGLLHAPRVRKLVYDLLAYIEQEKQAAIPDGYEVAEDPKTCTHALLASGEVVEAQYEDDEVPFIFFRIEGDDECSPYVRNLPHLGITLLRKVPEPKPEPRVYRAKTRGYMASDFDRSHVILPANWEPGTAVEVKEVLPE